MTSYRTAMRQTQIALVNVQRHLIESGQKILILLEGRDAAGKDSTIKRFTAHLSPRDTRVVALSKPSDKDRTAWYFQRYAPYLPAAGELVLFNRSWYNRAGVEKVMDFCTDDEYEEFMRDVTTFEHLLRNAGVQLFKYYLDISKKEQQRRLAARRRDPLKRWKNSPIDAVALEKWDAYTQARDAMLVRTHDERAPWYVVKADNKRHARLNLIRHFLRNVATPGKRSFEVEDETVVFQYSEQVAYRLEH